MYAKFTITYFDENQKLDAGTSVSAYYNEILYKKYSVMSSFAKSVYDFKRTFYINVVNSSVTSKDVLSNSKNAALEIHAVVYNG